MKNEAFYPLLNTFNHSKIIIISNLENYIYILKEAFVQITVILGLHWMDFIEAEFFLLSN